MQIKLKLSDEKNETRIMAACIKAEQPDEYSSISASDIGSSRKDESKGGKLKLIFAPSSTSVLYSCTHPKLMAVQI